jgi:hypothetical protein
VPSVMGSWLWVCSVDCVDSGQLVNHFSSIRCLTSKNGLVRSLIAYYSAIGLDLFDFTPTTFLVKNCRNSKPGDGTPWTLFLQRFKELNRGDFSRERLPAKHCRSNMWIVKPSGLNQGRGIQVRHTTARCC